MEKGAVAADARQAVKARLSQIIDALPVDKAEAVLDYAEYLEAKQEQAKPPRGSAEAIVQALKEVGPLQFEPGELELLLIEIDNARHMDYSDRDWLSPGHQPREPADGR